MKRFFSIFFILVTIAGTLHFSVSSHFCGGKLADMAIALGKADVSCGMEEGNAPCNKNESFGKNCCKDHVQPLIVTDNFIFSSVKTLALRQQPLFMETDVLLPVCSNSFLSAKILRYYHSPPANYLTTLSFLQVFRI